MLHISFIKYCKFLFIAATLLLASCATTQTPVGLPADIEMTRISELETSMLSLGHDIDPGEARRAAIIAIEYSKTLAQQYDLAGSPLFHNLMVQLGVRERGLCIHWTADLKARLEQEQFHSLDFHWAIANYETAFRFEHSSVVVSQIGADIDQGLILDPWRNSGQLHWAPALQDSGYRWEPRAEVHLLKREHQAEASNRSQVR